MQIDAGIDRKDNLAKVSEKVTVPARFKVCQDV